MQKRNCILPLILDRLKTLRKSKTSIQREGQAPPLQNFPTQKSAICNKQRILYIQFSALVKMVSGSKAIML